MVARPSICPYPSGFKSETHRTTNRRNQCAKEETSPPEEARLVSEQMIQKITGQLANFLKENPTKASDALNIFQDVFQLDPRTMNKPLRIGTRDSALALWQANTLQERLAELGIASTLVPIKVKETST